MRGDIVHPAVWIQTSRPLSAGTFSKTPRLKGQPHFSEYSNKKITFISSFKIQTVEEDNVKTVLYQQQLQNDAIVYKGSADKCTMSAFNVMSEHL